MSEEDTAAVGQLCSDIRPYRARQHLIEEGDCPEAVFLVVEGWACRYKLLPDGRRQIFAYLVPGDLCDVHVYILKHMDHSIALLSDAKVAVIPRRSMLDVLDERPRLAQSLWWSTLTDEAVLREWLVNIGQRDAYTRMAHLMVELWTRLRMVGGTSQDGFDLPLTQTDLGDTLGLTAVHVNRVLQRLRQEGLIEMVRGHLRIPDVNRLMDVCQFNPSYLHLDARPARGAWAPVA